MTKLIIILTLFFLSLIFPARAQNHSSADLQNLISTIQTADETQDLLKLSEKFDQISKSKPDDWLPLYYALLTKTFAAFQQNKEEAMKSAEWLEKRLPELEKLTQNNSEVITLKGLISTVKVSKDPINYGQIMSPYILRDYDFAMMLNPKNPRPMYLKSQFQMISTQYTGGDPKEFCPSMRSAKKLLEEENKTKPEPHWGESQVDEILSTTCM